MACYTCTENLCVVTIDCDNKGVINLNQNAPSTGFYKVELSFLGKTIISKEFAFTAGDNIEFEMPFLNENYCYSFQLKKENQLVIFPTSDKLVNTFNFCTKKEWAI